MTKHAVAVLGIIYVSVLMTYAKPSGILQSVVDGSFTGFASDQGKGKYDVATRPISKQVAAYKDGDSVSKMEFDTDCSLQCTVTASDENDFQNTVETFAEYVRKGVRKITLQVKLMNENHPHPLYVNTSRYYEPDRYVWLNERGDSLLTLPTSVESMAAQTLWIAMKSLQINLNSEPAGCVASLYEDCKIGLISRFLVRNVTDQVTDIYAIPDARLCFRVVDFALVESGTTVGFVKYMCCHGDVEDVTMETRAGCDKAFAASSLLKATDITLVVVIFFLIFCCFPFLVLRLIPGNWELPRVYQLEDTESNQRLVVIEECDLLHYDKKAPIGPINWLCRLCCICRLYNPDVNRRMDQCCYSKRKCGALGSLTWLHAYECARNFVLVLILCPLAYFIGLSAVGWIDVKQGTIEQTYLSYNPQVGDIVRQDDLSIGYVQDLFTSKVYVGLGIFFFLIFGILSIILIFYDNGELTRMLVKINPLEQESEKQDGSATFKFFFRAVRDDVADDLSSTIKINPNFPANLLKYWPDDVCESWKSCIYFPLKLVLNFFKSLLKLLLKIPLLSFLVRTVTVLHTSERINKGHETDDSFSWKIILHLVYCYCFLYMLFLISLSAYFILEVVVAMLAALSMDLRRTAPYVLCAVAVVMYWFGLVTDMNDHYLTIKKIVFEICRLPDYQKRHALCKHVFIKDILFLKKLTPDKLVYSDALVFESCDGKVESMHRGLFQYVCDEVSPPTEIFFKKIKSFTIKVLFILIVVLTVITFNPDPSFSTAATAAMVILPKLICLLKKSPKGGQIDEDILRNDIAEAIWNFEGTLYTPYYVIENKPVQHRDETYMTEIGGSDDFETANEEMISHVENNDMITIRLPINGNNKDQETAV